MSLGPVEVSATETLEAMGERIELTRGPHRQPARRRAGEPTPGTISLRLGPLLETHQRFPERTNVQLIRVDSEHELYALLWERGAGETSASGSSAVAAAAAAIANGWCESPVTVSMLGGTLRVEVDEQSRVTLVGAGGGDLPAATSWSARRRVGARRLRAATAARQRGLDFIAVPAHARSSCRAGRTSQHGIGDSVCDVAKRWWNIARRRSPRTGR